MGTQGKARVHQGSVDQDPWAGGHLSIPTAGGGGGFKTLLLMG